MVTSLHSLFPRLYPFILLYFEQRNAVAGQRCEDLSRRQPATTDRTKGYLPGIRIFIHRRNPLRPLGLYS